MNELADFNFTIKYRRGKENIDADSLSRNPMDIDDLKRVCTETVDPKCVYAVVSGVRVSSCSVTCAAIDAKKLVLEPESELSKVSCEELMDQQLKDDVIRPVYHAVAAGVRPSRREWSGLSRESRILMKSFAKLSLLKGVLVRRTLKKVQIVLPKEYHDMVYLELHEKMGHLGVEKVTELAQKRFYWPAMGKDIKVFIQKKCRCVLSKAPNVKEKAKLVPIEATSPFEMVSVDFLHLDKCKNKFEYAMVVIDHFTRYCQIYATRSKSSKAAADKLFNEFIVHYGCPTRIHHDQGGEFNSTMWKELHRFMGIKSSNTTPYHPQGDGQVERANRTIINMLKSLSENQKKDWNKFLPKLAFAYNSTVNKSTGMSPFYLMYGRESRLPIDSVFPEMVEEEVPRRSHAEFVKEWEKTMKEAVEIARQNIKKSAEYNKTNFDKKARAVELEIGDRVLMRNVRERGGTGKLRSYWEHAVFKVMKKREGLPVYEIQNVRKSKDVRVVHRNMLMCCNELPLSVLDDGNQPTKRASKHKESQQSTSKTEKEQPMPALEPIRVTTPALEPVVVDGSDSENDRIAVVVHAERETVPVGDENVVEADHDGLGEQAETEADDLVPVSNADDGALEGVPEVATEQDQDLSDSDVIESENSLEEESDNSLDTDHHTDQDETSEHEESDSEESESELPLRPKRTVCPKRVLSYDEGGKPMYKPVTRGKVEKIVGQVRTVQY